MKKFEIRINKIMQNLFWSNSASSLAFGMLIPFIAIFVTEEIEGGNLEIAGFAAGISPFVQGPAQFLAGPILDKLTAKNERWPFYFFIVNQAISIAYMLLFLLISTPLHLYLLQGGRGFVSGLTTPAGSMIQGKYMDKGMEGTQWGINGGTGSICWGLGGILSGIVTNRFGFDLFFILGSLFFFIATLFALKTLFEYNKTAVK